MNHLQIEERQLKRKEWLDSFTARHREAARHGALIPVSHRPPRIVGAEHTPNPPYGDYVETDCEDCGGTGAETGGLHTLEYEPCNTCNGARTVLAWRDWLGEALRMARGPLPGEYIPTPSKEHVIAIVAYARDHQAQLPEVA